MMSIINDAQNFSQLNESLGYFNRLQGASDAMYTNQISFVFVLAHPW